MQRAHSEGPSTGFQSVCFAVLIRLEYEARRAEECGISSLAVFTVVGIFVDSGCNALECDSSLREKKPLIETPSMRLAAARKVFMTRTRGSRIPLNVIRSTMEGWGRFTLVETPDKADLIIEIASSGDSGVQVSSSSNVSPETGHEEKSSSTRKDISPTDIKNDCL